MDEPGQPEEQPTAARRIALKVLWMFVYMVSFVLVAWGVAVLLTPSHTNYPKDQPPRDPKSRSFMAGERAEYILKLAGVQVGTGVFSVAPRVDSNDAPWHLSLKLSAFVGTLAYEANSTMNADFTRTISYHNMEKIPARGVRTVQLDFNDANRTVIRYLNDNRQGEPIQLPERYYDPLSMIYAFREMDFDAGKSIAWTVTDGKSKYMMSAAVERRETIEIGGRSLPSFLVIPDLGNFRGIFNQGKDAQMQIWFSDADDTLPLRITFDGPGGAKITAENSSFKAHRSHK